MQRSTIPEPAPASAVDYSYGDPRQLLSIAEWSLVRIRALCRANPATPACQDSKWPFPRGFANYFHPLDIGVQLLGFYGLAGDVTVSTVDRRPESETAGQVVQTSLVASRAAGAGPAIQYCSALPKTQYEVPYPAFADFYTAYMTSVAGQCSSRRNEQLGDAVQHQVIRMSQLAADPACFSCQFSGVIFFCRYISSLFVISNQYAAY